MDSNLLIIIYIIIILILLLLNLLNILKPYTALPPNQIATLFSSSILIILIFYFLKGFIINENNSYILVFAILYTLWYYLTKITSNKVISQHRYKNIISDIF